MPTNNKTPKLKLNSWLGTDKPMRSDFVEDNTLTVSVSRLKNKLGMYTEGKQQYIETIRGYGYRWNLRCVISEEESGGTDEKSIW